jgi:hypothetical protein
VSKKWNENEAHDSHQRHDHCLSVSVPFAHNAVDEESYLMYQHERTIDVLNGQGK